MYLTTKKEPLTTVQTNVKLIDNTESDVDYMYRDCLNGRDTSDLITLQLLYTPPLINITLLPCPLS